MNYVFLGIAFFVLQLNLALAVDFKNINKNENTNGKNANGKSELSKKKYFQAPHMHLLPDDNSSAHALKLKTVSKKSPYLNFDGDVKRNELLEVVIKSGEKNLDWLKLINSKRPSDKQLSFTSPSTRRGSPIETPNKYSPSIIRNEFDKFIGAAPEEFSSVINGVKSMPTELTLPESKYLELGLNMDRLYQIAIRWTLLEPYLNEMTENSAWDIRGYYFLSKMADLEMKLSNFKNLPELEQAQIKTWLVGLCRNSDLDNVTCARAFERYISGLGKGAYAFYKKYYTNGKNRYESNFQVPAEAARKDISWSLKNENVASIPFLEPESVVKDFMLNVEDEWKWENWQLKLDFKRDGFDMAYVVFQPGVTPNVERLGGNRITMDANQPLTEWETSWTIRHEFGHVLGFPDCYIEFYDVNEQAMVNYQIDVANLMCSRAGNLLKTHFDEMRRVYFISK